MSQDNGYIMSPNFPSNYDNYAEVKWYITVSYSYAVLMTVSYLQTESVDKLIFYDGSSTSSRQITR